MKRLIFISLMSILAGCTISSLKLSSQDPIRIGGVFDLSKSLSALDAPASKGALLASEEINAAGGLLGRPLDFMLRDTRSSSKKIKASVEQLIYIDKASALLGFSDTNQVLAANPLAQAADIPFISVGASSPRMADEFGEGENLILTAFGDNAQAALAAEYAISQFGSKALIIFENNKEYPALLSRYFKKRFEQLGGKIVGSYYYIGSPPILTPVTRQLKTLKSKPDFVLLASMPINASSVIRQLRLAGLQCPIIGGDSFDTPEIRQSSPSIIGPVYYTSHAFLSPQSSSEKVRLFVEKYKARYGAEPENSFAALGYDAMMLLAEGIRIAESTDTKQVITAIQELKDFDAVSGKLSYAPNRRVPLKQLSLIRIGSTGPELLLESMPEKLPVP